MRGADVSLLPSIAQPVTDLPFEQLFDMAMRTPPLISGPVACRRASLEASSLTCGLHTLILHLEPEKWQLVMRRLVLGIGELSHRDRLGGSVTTSKIRRLGYKNKPCLIAIRERDADFLLDQKFWKRRKWGC